MLLKNCSKLTLLLNDGHGAFPATDDYSLPGFPFDFCIADFDNEKGIPMSGLAPGVVLVEVRYADGTVRVGRVVVAQ